MNEISSCEIAIFFPQNSAITKTPNCWWNTVKTQSQRRDTIGWFISLEAGTNYQNSYTEIDLQTNQSFWIPQTSWNDSFTIIIMFLRKRDLLRDFIHFHFIHSQPTFLHVIVPCMKTDRLIILEHHLSSSPNFIKIPQMTFKHQNVSWTYENRWISLRETALEWFKWL